jgi:PAS domain S-box-containing protein
MEGTYPLEESFKSNSQPTQALSLSLQSGKESLHNHDPAETQRLLQELAQHQDELRVQQEELFTSQQEPEASNTRYAYLYEFAPVAYFSLNAKGLIRQCNQTAATLLGYERSWLLGHGLLALVNKPDQPVFFNFQESLRQGAGKSSCQVGVLTKQGATKLLRLEGSRLQQEGGQEEYLLAGMHVTEQEVLRQKDVLAQKVFNKYHTIIHSRDDGFCILELLLDAQQRPVDWRYLETNPVFEQQSGIENPVGRTIRELVPTIEPFWLEIYGQVALTGQPVRFQNHAQPLGRWFNVNALRIGEPQERQVAIFFTDITRHKRREANAAFLTEISQDLTRLSSANEIMHTVGEKVGQFLSVSACLFADVDESKGELSVQYAWSQVNVPSLVQTFRLEEYLSGEFSLAGRAGEKVVVRDTATDPRTDAAAYAALKVGAFVTIPFHRDRAWKAYLAVTDTQPRDWREDELELIGDLASRVFPRIERARAEEALRQSEERLQKALSIQTVGVIFFDLAGSINDANEAFCHMSGYAREDFIRGGVRWDVLTPAEFMDATLTSREELLTKGENTPYVKQYFRPDGSRWWGLFAGKRLSETECVEFVLDISEGKRAEAALQQMTQELAATNRELATANGQIQAANAELSRTNSHLSRVNADLDNFIYTASHDLKAPILNIEGLTKVLARKRHTLSLQDAQLAHVLHLIEDSVVRFKETISDLTDVARIQKQLEGESEPVVLQEIVQDTLLDLQPQVQESGAVIEQDLKACPVIMFPRKNLKSVVYNLLSNAIKYRDPSRPPHINITCQEEGDYLLLRVQDNGLGMDVRDPEKIFGMFKRQHAHVEGTGVGLYIVRKIIENAGGKIQVESQVDIGSTFRVYFKREGKHGWA